MKCSICGTENESTSKVCSNCGTSFLDNKKIDEDITSDSSKEVQDIVEDSNNNEQDLTTETSVIPSQDNTMDNDKGVVNETFQEENVDTNINQNQASNIEQINNELNMFETYDPNNSVFNKTLRFIKNNKKVVSIVIISIIVFIIGFKIFDKVYDGTKLSWVKNDDYEISVVTPSGSVNLSVEAYDEDNQEINEIKYSVSGGEIKVKGKNVEWILPKEESKYTITAKTPSGKTIKKKIEVKKVKDYEDKSNFAITYKEDTNDDLDSDKLKNDEEEKLGTNIRLKDTDHDGINDYDEVNKFKTDPKKTDTDSDGLNDSDELALGLDPLKEDSKGDKIKDGDRTLTYNTKYNNEVSLKINGKGNLASTTTIDSFENNAFNKVKGVSNKVYVFHTNAKMDDATVVIKYNIKDINKKGLNEKNLTLYYFNEETKEFEPQKTVLNTKKKTITATLTHFSKYVIGDNTVVSKNNNVNIMFVIDNSVSMYTKKQMSDAGYNRSTGAVGNDKEFKRLSLSNDMVNKFTGNYKFGVAEFSGDYVNIEKFTEEKNKAISSINSMKSKWKSNKSGTNIISALDNGIDEFDNKEESNYLLLLTDGKNTKGYFSSSTQERIIAKAKEKKVKICTIGLGEVDSSELKYISEQTGCDLYSASSSSTLDDIYNKLGADINYNLVDTNKDNKIDGTIIADSGFIVTRDGFSFGNYSSKQSNNGHCYGMATFAMLYYTKKLPMKLDKITTSTGFIVGVKELSSNGYNLKNTYFSNFKNLYDYTFKDEGLKLYMSGDVPNDYRYQGRKEVWRIRSKYKTLLDYSGFDIFVEDDLERARLNIESDKFNNNIKKDDRELLNAIWRLYVMQLGDKEVSFESDPDEAYKTLYDSLTNGVPIVLNISYKVGKDSIENHSVNAVRLIQRNDDPNDLEIEIYDNNYPGKPKYIGLQRYKSDFNISSGNTWFNDYEYVMVYDNKVLYTDDFFNTKGIGVTVSKLDI